MSATGEERLGYVFEGLSLAALEVEGQPLAGISPREAVVATLRKATGSSGAAQLTLSHSHNAAPLLTCCISPATVWRVAPSLMLLRADSADSGAQKAHTIAAPSSSSHQPPAADTDGASYSRCYTLRCSSKATADRLQQCMQAAATNDGSEAVARNSIPGATPNCKSSPESDGSQPSIPSRSRRRKSREPAEGDGTSTVGEEEDLEPSAPPAVLSDGNGAVSNGGMQTKSHSKEIIAFGAPNLPALSNGGSGSEHMGKAASGGAAARQRVGHAVAAGEGVTKNLFDRKTDQGSAELYFHYYSMIMHQQNMLQDYARTGTYYAAIVGNRPDFEGLTVMDVGAGSGILSLFAAQAGARKVYAVEASGIARYCRQLADANPALGPVLEVINSKVEAVQLTEKVDVLVSEPMGTLLLNERMIESYLFARDHFLKPGGKMFPQLGRIHAAAFSDDVLYQEVAAKGMFWLQPNFYGVDVTSLYAPAVDSYFSQVVVDAFEPSLLATDCATHVLDFGTMPESDLHDISIPLKLTVTHAPVVVHGIACWFDVFFNGAVAPTWLSTAPGLPTTHWFQLRCALKQPLFVTLPGTVVSGVLRLVAHSRQSYDIHLTLQAPGATAGTPPQVSTGRYDLKDPYYRQLASPQSTVDAAAAAAAVAAAAGVAGAAGVAATAGQAQWSWPPQQQSWA